MRSDGRLGLKDRVTDCFSGAMRAALVLSIVLIAASDPSKAQDSSCTPVMAPPPGARAVAPATSPPVPSAIPSSPAGQMSSSEPRPAATAPTPTPGSVSAPMAEEATPSAATLPPLELVVPPDAASEPDQYAVFSSLRISDNTASTARCDGKPDWCITVDNQSNTDFGIYIDGEPRFSVPAYSKAHIPFRKGERHRVKPCGEYSGQSCVVVPPWEDCGPEKTIEFNKNHLVTRSPKGKIRFE